MIPVGDLVGAPCVREDGVIGNTIAGFAKELLKTEGVRVQETHQDEEYLRGLTVAQSKIIIFVTLRSNFEHFSRWI